MAERQSMMTAEVVRKTLIDEHADFLKKTVAMVAAQLMEAEITTEIGAAHSERSAERETHRNGYEWLVGRRYLSAESIALGPRGPGRCRASRR
jgi:transposase-like protein